MDFGFRSGDSVCAGYDKDGVKKCDAAAWAYGIQVMTESTRTETSGPRDYCSSLRKTYNGFISGLSSNNMCALVVCGLPFYYSLGTSIYGVIVPMLYGKAAWIAMGVLLVAWLIAIISVWKTMPNLLTISVFIYTTMGHWCLVSAIILVCYLSTVLPISFTGYLIASVLPSTIFLIFCADVMRSMRRRMYDRIALASLASLASPSSSAPAVEPLSEVAVSS